MGEREGGRGGERSTRGRGREGRTSSSARGLLAAAAANEPRSLTRCARDAGIVPALARVSVCARACVHAFVRSCTRVRAYMQALPLCVGCMCAARMRARCAERTGTPNHVELFEESEHLLPAQPTASAENKKIRTEQIIVSTGRWRRQVLRGAALTGSAAYSGVLLRPYSPKGTASALDCCSDAGAVTVTWGTIMRKIRMRKGVGTISSEMVRTIGHKGSGLYGIGYGLK